MGTSLSTLQRLVTKTLMALGTVALLALPMGTALQGEALADHPPIPAYSGTIPLVQGFATTAEGWWIIFTNSQEEVAGMCDKPLDRSIVGCARWIDEETSDKKPIFPVKSCLVMIFVSDENEHVKDIVEHELKHCNEGAFHK